MKRILLTLALFSGAAQAAPLRIVPVERLQTNRAVGNPVMLTEADGSKTVVQLEELSDEFEKKYNYRLVAYTHTGREILETKAGKPQAGENLFITDARRNQAGDLVVLTYYSRNTATSGRVYSDNLTTHKSAMIVEGSFPALVDRIRVNGQNLALVRADLGSGPNDTRPELLRLVNEDDGKVLSQTLLDHGVSGRLGLNSRGEVKALLRGYELFGLLDVMSGKFEPLFPNRKPPAAYPEPIHLAIGDFLLIGDQDASRLLDIRALFDGEVKVVRSFAPHVAFIGGKAPTMSVEQIGDGLVIKDLRTGEALGKAVPNPAQNRAKRTVEEVVETPLGKVALVSELTRPGFFVSGTTLTYVKLATGEVIRQKGTNEDLLMGQILVKDGRVLSLEITGRALDGNSFSLVDLERGTSLAHGDGLVLTLGFQLPSGRIVGMKSNAQKQLCFADVEDAANVACSDDALLNSDAVRFGYRPMELGRRDGRILLPLVAPASFGFSNRGFVDLEVRD